MMRRLSPEELRLWRLATAQVKPLRVTPPRPLVREEARAVHAQSGAAQASIGGQAVKQAVKQTVLRPSHSTPVTPALDRREKKALKKGKKKFDAILDLHGYRAQEAHDRLIHFLIMAQAADARLILVITGKGGFGGADPSHCETPGVLRRHAPHWLAGPQLRNVVAGFEEAAEFHGGGGALYVRLRRRS